MNSFRGWPSHVVTLTLAIAGTYSCGVDEVVLPATSANPAEVWAPGLLSQDLDAIMMAAANEVSILELAKQAQIRAGDVTVKQYSQAVIRAHGGILQSLTQLAQRRHAELDAQMSRAGAQQWSSLFTCAAGNFDRAFLNAQVQAQQSAVAALSLWATHAQDPELRTWAADAQAAWSRDAAWAQRLCRDVVCQP